ncbi:NADH-quinone oxidoreductase subunit 5 family protein [Micromonospora craniellae]|uniref:NADH-quinone oxidoreductase subunit L n=1 Tax=Micromonospora craniellae TaxID=2294034 RepID=A0A372G5U8_9ACTN|nr:NADH-quinone oxidoreductase subunit L [Micromonospora craniellae]QOC90229.1 NADH-quinone oxidoreductase subunit L [Micromonospora craniellae]RFS48382.1 NADH-quinone oxidoreductase subunit L [Micromonospora craniellae]
MSTATLLGVLLPVVPLVAGLAGLLLPPSPRGAAAGAGPARRVAVALGVTGAAGALALAGALLVTLDGPVEASTTWIDLGGLAVTLGVRLDGAAALVAVAVAAVALAVQVYSTGYLSGGPRVDVDHRYPPYAAQISLFTAAMLLVVVSGDLILLLVGWEVMGLCSYLLIAHDRRLPEAPAAAMKAFLVTRVGDVGFLLGIALLGVSAGSFRIADVLAHSHSTTTLTAACLLLLAGVAGKSAQFPLHTWLPDAMAGPTPISALIHAATMVAAGVYAVTRLWPLFEATPVALAVLGVMASVTLLLGALAATAQDDIKRVLAWSTVSQLGYMTGALAVGSPPAALFHLLTHAAFKALLFLAAGAVIHSLGTALMSRMGGLRRTMPVTFWCMLIGLGALAGVPPLSGFWSKEGVLAAAEGAALHGDGPSAAWVGWLVWIAGLVGVAVTAWYATRLLLRTFFHATRTPLAHPHDPPAVLRWPLLVLAVPAALLGLAGFPGWFSTQLQRTVPADPEAVSDLMPPDGLIHLTPAVLLPLALLLVGAGLAWVSWRRDSAADPATALGPLRPVLARAFRLDDVQHALVVRPTTALGRLARTADERVVDGAVTGTGRAARALGGGLGTLHRAALPRAVVAVLAGALLLGLAAVLIGGAA